MVMARDLAHPRRFLALRCWLTFDVFTLFTGVDAAFYVELHFLPMPIALVPSSVVIPCLRRAPWARIDVPRLHLALPVWLTVLLLPRIPHRSIIGLNALAT